MYFVFVFVCVFVFVSEDEGSKVEEEGSTYTCVYKISLPAKYFVFVFVSENECREGSTNSTHAFLKYSHRPNILYFVFTFVSVSVFVFLFEFGFVFFIRGGRQ